MAYQKKSLDGWVATFDSIYGRKNLALGLSDILQRLVEETVEIVKPVLTMNIKNVEYTLPDVLAWACAFSTKSQLSLPKAMENKYLQKPPGKDQPSIDIYSAIGKDKPETLDDWQTYLRSLYAEQNRDNGPQYLLTKLTEDIGTASQKLRKGEPIGDVMDKVGAALAWLIALANHFQSNLSKVTWEKYPAQCVHCNQRECACSALTRIFVGYTFDTTHYRDLAEKTIKDIGLVPISFPDFGPSFQRTRMVEMFDAISKSDGGVVVLKSKYSANVYAELLEMLRTMDNDNVWILVSGKTALDRDPQLAGLLNDVEHFHLIDWFESETELIDVIRKSIGKRLKDIQASVVR